MVKIDFDNCAVCGMVFDDEGNLIYQADGAKDRISFSPQEVNLMRGKTLTHNHPSSSPFSEDDVRFFFETNLKEIRATGREYTYILSAPSDFRYLSWHGVYSKWAGSITETKNEWLSSNPGASTLKEISGYVWRDYNHAVGIRFAEKMGLNYTRIKRSK